jgi:D-alanyl-D-alanine carboxypeptidase
MEKLQVAAHSAAAATETEPLLVAPRGLEQITSSFGDIYEYIAKDGQLDARWPADFLQQMLLPFPLRLSWDLSRTITRMICHRRLTSVFGAAFGSIQEHGLQEKITSFGGCFAFRPQRSGNKLSAHSWGIAIDLNPETNPQGSAGNMAAGLIEIFRQAGLEWGGDWSAKTRDSMHFQFCTEY